MKSQHIKKPDKYGLIEDLDILWFHNAPAANVTESSVVVDLSFQFNLPINFDISSAQMLWHYHISAVVCVDFQMNNTSMNEPLEKIDYQKVQNKV